MAEAEEDATEIPAGGESNSETLIGEIDEMVCRAGSLFAKCFTVPQKRTALTKKEITSSRETWNRERRDFENEFTSCIDSLPKRASSQKDLVSKCILPPEFATGVSASSRSRFAEQRKKRYYPDVILEWTGFEEETLNEASRLDNTPFNKKVNCPLDLSITLEYTVQDEKDEQKFLDNVVFHIFSQAGMMTQRYQLDDLSSKNRATPIGKPDMVGFVRQQQQQQPSGNNDDGAEQGKKSFAAEFKSTQNLLLPNDFSKLKDAYEGAVQQQNEKRNPERSAPWSQIGHPIAQLCAYMMDNGVRYGALVCAAKTYFVRFVVAPDNGTVERVEFTGAYLTGSRNFLRAWAGFIKLAEKDPAPIAKGFRFFCPVTWLKKTPISEDTEEDDNGENDDGGAGGGEGGGSRRQVNGSDKNGRNSNETNNRRPKRQKKSGSKDTSPHCSLGGENGAATAAESPPDLVTVGSADSNGNGVNISLTPPRVALELFDFEEKLVCDGVPYVDPQDLEIGSVIGTGRNGDVFESTFKGEPVAVKQYDLSKNFSSYKGEIEAYSRLREVWGELVPEPKFISESPSGMVQFLGLQKGRTPSNEDDVGAMFGKVIRQLRSRCNFQPLDSSRGHNCILVKNGEDDVEEKLLVVDLEYWEDANTNKKGGS